MYVAALEHQSAKKGARAQAVQLQKERMCGCNKIRYRKERLLSRYPAPPKIAR